MNKILNNFSFKFKKEFIYYLILFFLTFLLFIFKEINIKLNPDINYTNFKYFILLSYGLICLSGIIIFISIFKKDFFIQNFQLNLNQIFILFCIFVIYYTIRLTFHYVPLDLEDGYQFTTFAYLVNNKLVGSVPRNLPYPFIVLLIVLIFKNFIFIVIIHSILALIAAILLYNSWLEIYNIFIKERFKDNDKILYFHFIMGLLLIILFLFNLTRIRTEQLLRPEPMTIFYLSLYIFLFIQCIKSSNIFLYSFTILFLFFLEEHQPKFSFFSYFCIIQFIIMFFYKNKQLFNNIDKSKIINITKKIFIIILLPIIIYLIFITSFSLIFYEDKEIKKFFLSKILFISNYNIIHYELLKDYKRIDYFKYSKETLKDFLDYFDQFKNLYFNQKKDFDISDFDYIIAMSIQTNFWDNMINKYFRSDNNNINKFLNYYYFRSVILHPLTYIKKVIKQYFNFYLYNSNYLENIKQLKEHEKSYLSGNANLRGLTWLLG